MFLTRNSLPSVRFFGPKWQDPKPTPAPSTNTQSPSCCQEERPQDPKPKTPSSPEEKRPCCEEAPTPVPQKDCCAVDVDTPAPAGIAPTPSKQDLVFGRRRSFSFGQANDEFRFFGDFRAEASITSFFNQRMLRVGDEDSVERQAPTIGRVGFLTDLEFHSHFAIPGLEDVPVLSSLLAGGTRIDDFGVEWEESVREGDSDIFLRGIATHTFADIGLGGDPNHPRPAALSLSMYGSHNHDMTKHNTFFLEHAQTQYGFLAYEKKTGLFAQVGVEKNAEGHVWEDARLYRFGVFRAADKLFRKGGLGEVAQTLCPRCLGLDEEEKVLRPNSAFEVWEEAKYGIYAQFKDFKGFAPMGEPAFGVGQEFTMGAFWKHHFGEEPFNNPFLNSLTRNAKLIASFQYKDVKLEGDNFATDRLTWLAPGLYLEKPFEVSDHATVYLRGFIDRNLLDVGETTGNFEPRPRTDFGVNLIFEWRF